MITFGIMLRMGISIMRYIETCKTKKTIMLRKDRDMCMKCKMLYSDGKTSVYCLTGQRVLKYMEKGSHDKRRTPSIIKLFSVH